MVKGNVAYTVGGGYQLVGTDVRCCNAFFVRSDLCGDKFITPATAENLYNPLRRGLKFVASHSPKYCLAVQQPELGIFNYRDYVLESGFNNIESDDAGVRVWTKDICSKMKICIPKGCHSFTLPCGNLPAKVTKKFWVQITVGEKEKYKFFPGSGEFLCTMKVPESNTEILNLSIEVPFLWTPSKILGTSDNRTLGVCINISGISFE